MGSLELHRSPGADENPIPERGRAGPARGAPSHRSLEGSASYSSRRTDGWRRAAWNIARVGSPQGIVGWGEEDAGPPSSGCSLWAVLSSAKGLISAGLRRTSEWPSLCGCVELAEASPAGQG